MFEAKKYTEIFDLMRGHAGGILNDFDAGSVTRTLTEAFAFELALLYEKMRLVYLSGFVDTAEGGNLDNVVAVLGVKRGLPDFSEGFVAFTRDPGKNDIIVPAGTLVATEERPEAPKKVYQTLEELIISKDQIENQVRIQAAERGEEQNTPAGTIVVLPRPVPGVKSVSNSGPITLSGKRRETDEALRRRAKNTLIAAGKATKFAIENALIQLPKVRDVKVIEDFSKAQNYGVIDIYIDHPDFTKKEDPIYADFENAVNKVRAAGILPRINPSPVTTIDATFKIKAVQPNLTGKELAELEAKMASAVRNYIESVAINEPLSVSKMVKQLLLTEGVDSLENYRMKMVQPQPDSDPEFKTFSDTADIKPPDNGRFRINTLQVFANIKTIRGEVHFLLPQGLQLKELEFIHEQKDPTADPFIVSKDAIVKVATGAEIKSMIIIRTPWQKPETPLIDDTFTVNYAEKVHLKLIPYHHTLNIWGAFVIDFPSGTSDTKIQNVKESAAQNLTRFFQMLPPADHDKAIITFDEMIKAAQTGIDYTLRLNAVSDFWTTLDDKEEKIDRVTPKGIQLNKNEKAQIGIDTNLQ